MNETGSIPVSDLRRSLATMIDRIERGERMTVTRNGEPVAVLLPPDEAAWCTSLAARFRNRQAPFTQAVLDTWIADVLARKDLSELLEPQGSDECLPGDSEPNGRMPPLG